MEPEPGITNSGIFLLVAAVVAICYALLKFLLFPGISLLVGFVPLLAWVIWVLIRAVRMNL